MVIVCWSVKGGSGTTVTAACLAAVAAHVAHRPTLLVDLAGDAPAALGVDLATNEGVVDWLAAAATLPAGLGDPRRPPHGEPGGVAAPMGPGGHEHRVEDDLSLLPRGSAPIDAVPCSVGPVLVERLAADGRLVVVDAGTRVPGTPPTVVESLVAAADRSLLVIRPCYLALRRVARATRRPDGVVLVAEAGRSLDGDDVEAVVGAPVVATIRCEPRIARIVDAGLLWTRVPRNLERPLLDLVEG